MEAERALARTTDTALLATPESLVNEWLAHLHLMEDASPNTLATYERSLQIFVDWLRENGQGLVTPVTITEFRADLQARYAPQTVNLRLTAIRSFYRWSVETGRLPLSPAAGVKGVKRPKSRQHKRDRLTDEEMRRLLATCQAGGLVDIRDRAMLSLFAYCALREVEVVRANIGHLRTESERLMLDVVGKGRSEADEAVVIPLHQEGVIREWLAHRLTFARHGTDDPLFISLSSRSRGSRLSLRGVRQIVKGRYRQAGVVGERKTVHSLRHTAITNAIRQGASPMQVRQMARHESFDTTLIYIHEAARVGDPAEDYISYGQAEGGVKP